MFPHRKIKYSSRSWDENLSQLIGDVVFLFNIENLRNPIFREVGTIHHTEIMSLYNMDNSVSDGKNVEIL